MGRIGLEIELRQKARGFVKFCIVVFALTLVITIVCLLMLKYAVEGENNMPFELSQMLMVSTAEGIDIDGESTWNFDLVQNNDIYLYLLKNKNYKEEEIIKSVTLNHFEVTNGPTVREYCNL